MRQGKTLVLTFLMTALLAGFSGQAMVVSPSNEFTGPISTEGGGRSMLVEEITATWCPSCAEIDPELLQVADSHGSRIALVALHPSDGEDAFQPAASQHRIDRLETVQAGVSTSTPTFVVEAGAARRGYDAWADVQRDILNEELARQTTSGLDITVERTAQGYRASVASAALTTLEGTQLTMLVVEHGKPMPDGFVNPGLDHRDRVVVGLAECSLDNHTITTSLGLLGTNVADDCTTSFSVEFDELASWSVLLIHESTQETLDNGGRSTSYGVVELAYRERADPEPTSGAIGPALLVGCVVLAVASIVRKK
ncbi:MAG: TlpA family protein disulfide reductase [Poseidonia sp.]